MPPPIIISSECLSSYSLPIQTTDWGGKNIHEKQQEIIKTLSWNLELDHTNLDTKTLKKIENYLLLGNEKLPALLGIGLQEAAPAKKIDRTTSSTVTVQAMASIMTDGMMGCLPLTSSPPTPPSPNETDKKFLAEQLLDAYNSSIQQNYNLLKTIDFFGYTKWDQRIAIKQKPAYQVLQILVRNDLKQNDSCKLLFWMSAQDPPKGIKGRASRWRNEKGWLFVLVELFGKRIGFISTHLAKAKETKQDTWLTNIIETIGTKIIEALDVLIIMGDFNFRLSSRNLTANNLLQITASQTKQPLLALDSFLKQPSFLKDPLLRHFECRPFLETSLPTYKRILVGKKNSDTIKKIISSLNPAVANYNGWPDEKILSLIYRPSLKKIKEKRKDNFVYPYEKDREIEAILGGLEYSSDDDSGSDGYDSGSDDYKSDSTGYESNGDSDGEGVIETGYLDRIIYSGPVSLQNIFRALNGLPSIYPKTRLRRDAIISHPQRPRRGAITSRPPYHPQGILHPPNRLMRHDTLHAFKPEPQKPPPLKRQKTSPSALHHSTYELILTVSEASKLNVLYDIPGGDHVPVLQWMTVEISREKITH